MVHNAYLWLGNRIALDNDILALLSVQERDPALQQAFTRVVDWAQQPLIVLVDADVWAQANRAADSYDRVLAPYPELLQSADPMTDHLDWLAFLQSHRLNLLTPQAEAPDASTLDSRHLLGRLSPTLVLTLVTTVIGYLILALTSFPGLRQMAVFSVLGPIFAWLRVVFGFPILVRADTLKSARVVNWCAISLERWPLFRVQRLVLWMAGLFIAFIVFGFSRLAVQDGIRLLQNPPKNLIEDQIKLSKLLDAPTPTQFYKVRVATPEVVLQREEMLKERLDPLIQKHVISGYQALSKWVPSSRT